MKRSKQGYVLALVLVVMLLLTSVASVVAATSVRNIETGGASFAQERAHIQTGSDSRKQALRLAVDLNKTFFQHLKASESDEGYPVPQGMDGAVYFVSQLNEYIGEYPRSYDDPPGNMDISLLPEPEEGQTIFRVSVSSSSGGQTVEAEITITVDYPQPDESGGSGESGESDNPEETVQTVVRVLSVEYSSFSIL